MTTQDTTQDTAWQAGESAAGVLGPEAGVFASADEAGLGAATLAVLRRAARKPGATAAAGVRYWTSLALAGPVATARWLGLDAAPPVPVPEGDKRFADPAWTDNPAFFAVRQAHLAAARLAQDLLAAGAGDQVDDAKAALMLGFLLDAAAPTNFLLTNPAALKRALETGGASVMAGAAHAVDDLLHNGGRPRKVDTRSFRVGENLAATPGKVVFRNELMELIQYAPESPQVSAISYRNPDTSMSGVTLDDYLIHGPRDALDVIGEITGSPATDIIGLCLGGALTAMLAAYLTEKGDDRIGSITLLNTLLDYSEPGVLGVFTDEKTVAQLERQMAKTGVLEGSQMAGTFDMLRANDLIFSYVVSNWLMGQDPPPFDILAWNGDTTRMPTAMHSFYLRSLYMRNELATGQLELAGQQLSLAAVRNDTYVVGAINDHIVPWHSSYKTGALLGGDVRYVLSSGGHIAGIVNPPGPRAWYEAAGYAGPGPEAWRAANSKHQGSWWQDWTTWSGTRAGELITPPSLGSTKYPPLSDAPRSEEHTSELQSLRHLVCRLLLEKKKNLTSDAALSTPRLHSPRLRCSVTPS